MERAAINIFVPLARGTSLVGDYSELAWEGGYTRDTFAMGGEHSARFRISQDDLSLEELENIFQNWLGYRMVESFAGKERHFFVNEARLSVGSQVISWSLDDMYNQVNWYYKTDSAASYALTAVAENSESQGIFGDKKAVITSREYIPATAAGNKRDQYLADHAFPLSAVTSTSGRKRKKAVLELRFKGFVHEIGYEWYNSTSTSTLGRSTHISSVISLASNISTGSIVTDSTTISPESDNWITRHKRLHDVVSDSGYRYFVTNGRKFYYEAVPSSEIFYTRREMDDIDHVYRNGQRVPSPLVEPGRIIWTEDLFSARKQSATLLHDPRARYIAKITYDKNGVRQTGGVAPTRQKQKADLALSFSRSISNVKLSQNSITRLTKP